MSASPPRNWIFKCALAVLSAAFAALGVFGWADAARLFDALRRQHVDVWAFLVALDPLWPVFAVCCLGCVAAQFFAACALVNFARLAKSNWKWRGLCVGFYAISAAFAGYSADLGAKIVLTMPHRAAYETRERERRDLAAEIAALNDRISNATAELLSYDPATTNRDRQNSAQAAFALRTKRDNERLPIAQGELDARPPIPREPAPDPVGGTIVLLLFITWAFLEPWGWPLADRGRVRMPGCEDVSAPDMASPGADILPDTAHDAAPRAPRVDPALAEQLTYLRTVNERYARVWRMKRIERRSFGAIAGALAIKIPAVQRALRGAEKALAARRQESLAKQNVIDLHPERAVA